MTKESTPIPRTVSRSLIIAMAYGMDMRPQKLCDMTNNGVNEQQAKELIEKYRQLGFDIIEQRFGSAYETNPVK